MPASEQPVGVPKLLSAVKRGIFKGLRTFGMLSRIVIPIYLAVVLFKHTVFMTWLQEAARPVMKLFQLPPDAAVPVITGMFADEYGAVAALGGFDFSSAAITTVAMIVLAAHGVPVEAAIAQKIGLPGGLMAALRLATAFLTGILVGFIGGLGS
jgi:hypothetical protein